MNQLSQEKKEKINKMARQVFVQNNLDYDDPKAQIVPLNRIFTESPIIVAELPNGKTLSTENAVKFLEREIGFEMPDLQTDERKLSGFLYVAQDGKQFRGCILTDKTEPTVRRRFSAAHELGHYLLHFLPLLEIAHTENLFLTESLAFGEADENKAEIEMAEDFGFRQINQEKKHEMETEADFFAAEILMPRNACLQAAQILKLNPEKNKKALIDRLATEFLVSFEAMKRRLEDLGAFDEEF